MYLIFDTETSNIPQKNLPLNHVDQRRIMQLAAILLDPEFKEVASMCVLINIPENINISPGAQAAHGISKEMCKRYGVEIESALTMFYEMYVKSEYHIGHNISFDINGINDELALAEQATLSFNPVCTMHMMTEVCKLPHLKWPGKYKWPKLQEAYKHCFGVEFDGAHDALADVRASAKVFQWLKESNRIPSMSAAT